MKTIITVQHTQSIHHTNGMVGSWTDWDLTETGIAQANRIAENLHAEYADVPFAIYASDLKRAAQTAKILANHFDTSVTLRPELRERNLGKCCGKSVKWLRENMETQEKTVDDKLFSDAESRREEWNRLSPFFAEIMNSDAQNILVVSHGDLLAVFCAMFMGMDVSDMARCELFGSAGGVSILIENDQKKRVIKRFGDLSYLK